VRFVAKGAVAVCAVAFLSGCTTSYPYLALDDHCMCEEYVYHELPHNILFDFSARFSMSKSISSVIKIKIENMGTDTVSLKQAVAKVTSNTVAYRYNGIFLPMPYVDILPGENYSLEMVGSDTRMLRHPINAIVGERMTVVLWGITANRRGIDSVVVHFQPVNPEFGS
jgi:hypothetical protein